MGIQYLVLLIYLPELFISFSEGIVSSSCWDGTVGVDYIGTSTLTKTGYTCQGWMVYTPHSHTVDQLSYFPYDQDTGPSNYCRDPGGWSPTGPWCYTMNPSVTWETCDIPICSNLPCASGGTSRGQSDPSTTIANIDSNSGKLYLLKDTTTYSVSCCGTIAEWRFYARNAGTLRLQIWRLNTASGNYRLIGKTSIHSVQVLPQSGETDTTQTKTVTQADRISVEEGDLIGWYQSGVDMLPYSTGTTNQNVLLTSGVVAVGTEVDFGAGTVENARDYAVGVTIAKGLVPYFTNTASSLSITTAETVGSTLSVLTVTDDDTDDVSSLTVSVEANTYFDVSGLNIVVKAGLVTGSVNVTFTVTDHCGLIGSHIMTMVISTSPIDIATIPATASVSETVTVETLVHNITVTPADSYTCVFVSYSPTRAAGNPFEIKASPYLDFGVYLKSAANLQYSVTTSYTLVINCSSSTDTITETLTVHVDPNNPPTFSDFQSTITISATATPAFTVIYNATVTDADNDAMTLTLYTDPVTSSFTLGNDGVIQTAEDMTYHTQGSYTFIISASDGHTTVNSTTITVTLSDINIKPALTNVPSGTQTILENQAAGTELFQVSSTDGNGDTATFNVNFSPTTCSTMFSLDTSTGSMTSLAQFDYDTLTVTECNATITAFDGKNVSDVAMVTIQVTNVDETPVIQQSTYLASTPEVASGTALPDLGIVVTEPEGQTVTLTLNCNADSGYLSIHGTTGIITMATAYDIDTSGVDSYTISCDLMAADTAGNTATSALSVTITDANDNAPIFSQTSYSVYLVTGHSGFGTLLTAGATDGDRTSPNKDITYSLSATTHFNIDASGNLYNTADLSGDAAGTIYSLTITATDGGTPSQSDTASLTVTVSSTTVAPTPAAAASSSVTSSKDGSFFSDTGNIVFLIISALLFAGLAVLTGLFVWKFCLNNKTASSPRFVNHPRPTRPMETKVPISPEPANQTHRPPADQTYRPNSGESGISLTTNNSSASNPASTDWLRRIENIRDSPLTPRHINVRSLTHDTSLF